MLSLCAIRSSLWTLSSRFLMLSAFMPPQLACGGCSSLSCMVSLAIGPSQLIISASFLFRVPRTRPEKSISLIPGTAAYRSSTRRPPLPPGGGGWNGAGKGTLHMVAYVVEATDREQGVGEDLESDVGLRKPPDLSGTPSPPFQVHNSVLKAPCFHHPVRA